MFWHHKPIKYNYYGQHGEDYLLWHLFDFRRTGFFLDVGAHDGVALSNTKSFEEAGWTGICVEPIPEVSDTCRRVRRRVVCAACVAGDIVLGVLRCSRERWLDAGREYHQRAELRRADRCGDWRLGVRATSMEAPGSAWPRALQRKLFAWRREFLGLGDGGNVAAGHRITAIGLVL